MPKHDPNPHKHAHAKPKVAEAKPPTPTPPAAKPADKAPKPPTPQNEALPVGAQPPIDRDTTSHKELASSDHPKAPEHPLRSIDREAKANPEGETK